MRNFRKKGPSIQTIKEVIFPPYQELFLDNGIPVYIVSQGTQEILKMEIVFESGRPFEQKKVVSRVTNSLIKEGSAHMSSKQISDTVDYYGASLRTSENLDHCSLHLFTLSKYFEQLLPVFHEVVTSPVFPQEELRKYINVNAERLKVELEKNDVIAYRAITEHIFGKDHPYGYNSEIEDYQKITREDLVAHYEKNYGANNCTIFLSGKVEPHHIEAVQRVFGGQMRTARPEFVFPEVVVRPPSDIHIPSGKELQTAIKIGRRLFGRNHPDYPGVYFLNSVFGGYFGSRLMSNIREEKGYTYNIYSEVDAMKHDGIFLIGTEVGDEYFDETLKEIRNEMELIREELVDEEELEMVRNYLLGRILNFVDGPFNSARMLKTMVISNLGLDYFDHLIDEIKNTDAVRLQSLARTYFNEEDLWTITVGKSR